MQIIIGADGENHKGLGEWVQSRTRNYTLPADYVAIGVSNGGRGQGVVVYHTYDASVPSLVIDVAGEGYWMTRESLRILFAYPFIELGCRRITALASKKNKRSRKIIQKVGFTQEGVLRSGEPDGCNRIVYGMLREECRWIGEGNADS